MTDDKRKFIPWNPETIPLSKSNVQMFDRCPYRFKLQVIDKLDLTSPEMEKGSQIHKAVADAFLNMDYDEIMKGNVEEQLRQILPEPEYDTFVQLQITRYNALKYKELFFPVYQETYLFDPELNYSGTFDRLDAEDDGSYIAIDWKSGAHKNWNDRNYRYEMMGYIHLINKVLGIKVRKFVVFFFRDGFFFGPEVPHPSTERAFYSRTNRVRGKIRRCLEIGNFPKKRQMCQWCPYVGMCSADSAEQVSDKRLPRDEKGRVIP